MGDTESKLLTTALDAVEASLARPVPTAAFEVEIQDALLCFRSTVTAHYDIEQVDAGPDDWRTVPRALIKYIRVDHHTFDPRELTETELSAIQDECDADLEAMS